MKPSFSSSCIKLSLLAFRLITIIFGFHLVRDRDFREVFEVGEATDDPESSENAAFRIGLQTSGKRTLLAILLHCQSLTSENDGFGFRADFLSEAFRSFAFA